MYRECYVLPFASEIQTYSPMAIGMGINRKSIISFSKCFGFVSGCRNIISEYLILNTPTALQELIVGLWLLVKGFDKRIS